MKIFKKIGIGILAACIAIGATACGNGGNGGKRRENRGGGQRGRTAPHTPLGKRKRGGGGKSHVRPTKKKNRRGG